MATWPSERVDALWQAAAVVPRALLDADTRLMAARRMFDARHEQPMRAAAAFAKTIARAAEALVRHSCAPDLADAISARQPAEGKSGWLAMPAMSIAMAILARLAARGNANCSMLEREYRGKWKPGAVRAGTRHHRPRASRGAGRRRLGSNRRTLMTHRFDPLETSASISSGYRRYLRSLLSVATRESRRRSTTRSRTARCSSRDPCWRPPPRTSPA